MTYSKKLWLWLGGIFVVSFAILGLIGREIYVQAPPVPSKVVSASGGTIFTRADIQSGREVLQTLGGIQLGSIWGHGGYVAPDWGADWLHREATTLLDIWARHDGAKNFAALDPERQAALKERLKRDLRTNAYDVEADTITVSDARAEAMDEVGNHYATLFSSDPSLRELRIQYAIPERSILDAGQRARLGDEEHAVVPATDPFLTMKPTASMKATTKYFVTVIAMFLAQVLLGAITAHYAVEGQEFYGYNISEVIPYALTRTWHTQLGIFWIAVAWLATGLYVAPMLSNHEPKYQKLGVNLLYGALLVVVIGSFAGE